MIIVTNCFKKKKKSAIKDNMTSQNKEKKWGFKSLFTDLGKRCNFITYNN